MTITITVDTGPGNDPFVFFTNERPIATMIGDVEAIGFKSRNGHQAGQWHDIPVSRVIAVTGAHEAAV